MELFLFVLAVIGWSGALYYRSKAKEFESLFELSKGYEVPVQENDWKWVMGADGVNHYTNTTPKLNKDGSIAKKRGPKPKNNKEVK